VVEKFGEQLADVSFQAFSPRLCTLDFTFRSQLFRAFSVYFPTTWDSDEAIDELYDLIDFLLEDCRTSERIPFVGGDFNASIGLRRPDDDTDALGAYGVGARNARGQLLIEFVLRNGLHILSRQGDAEKNADSWTCRRAMDSALVQIDFLLADFRLQCRKTWCDNCVGVGLDHRSLHCTIACAVKVGSRKLPSAAHTSFKGWRPTLDQDGKPSAYQQHLVNNVANHGRNFSAEFFEELLEKSAAKFGSTSAENVNFKPSAALKAMRVQRRSTQNPAERRSLSFAIRKKHRQETREWKSKEVNKLLSHPAGWKHLRGVQAKVSGRVQLQEPAEDEFASMLEGLFQGCPQHVPTPTCLTEVLFDATELDKSISKLKTNKSSDERGLAAELLKHAPQEFRNALLTLFNDVLEFGSPPSTWRRTIFNMLPKSAKSKSVTEYRPIASLRLLYKVFAYLLLGRIEDKLEATQPEEQHAFRGDYRLEEHLLTAGMFIEKTRAQNISIWAISLDLSKAFDRIDWPSLWTALRAHGVSEQIVWILSCLYQGQSGHVRGKSKSSKEFDILAGVRQGCVLSPRLFCCVLEWAMAKWRRRVQSNGFDLGDGMRRLLDLRFADDVVFFARTQEEAAHLLDTLVEELAKVGLQLNASKTVALTTQAQPPDSLRTPQGKNIKRVDCHKWLGCILEFSCRDQSLSHHVHAATMLYSLTPSSAVGLQHVLYLILKGVPCRCICTLIYIFCIHIFVHTLPGYRWRLK